MLTTRVWLSTVPSALHEMLSHPATFLSGRRKWRQLLGPTYHCVPCLRVLSSARALWRNSPHQQSLLSHARAYNMSTFKWRLHSTERKQNAWKVGLQAGGNIIRLTKTSHNVLREKKRVKELLSSFIAKSEMKLNHSCQREQLPSPYTSRPYRPRLSTSSLKDLLSCYVPRDNICDSTSHLLTSMDENEMKIFGSSSGRRTSLRACLFFRPQEKWTFGRFILHPSLACRRREKEPLKRFCSVELTLLAGCMWVPGWEWFCGLKFPTSALQRDSLQTGRLLIRSSPDN